MNFVAIIGIAEKINTVKGEDNTQVLVKVEKPFVENQEENWYDLLTVQLDKTVFKQELKSIAKGDIVGIKGRLRLSENLTEIIGERLQVF